MLLSNQLVPIPLSSRVPRVIRLEGLHHLTISTIILFFLLLAPFCCGVYRLLNWCLIPTPLHISSNWFEVYSVPLSLLTDLMLKPVYFSTNNLNFLNMATTSLFCFKKKKKKTQLILVKSSINSTKYFLPFQKGVCIGPQTSLCINCSFSTTLYA